MATCGDTCVDISTDIDHCGACDASCTDAERCDQGACVPAACLLRPWSFAKALTVQNRGDTLVDYSMRITLDTATLIAAGKMNADCSDLRFTLSLPPPMSASGGLDEELSYWLESDCNQDQTVVWVRVPTIFAGETTLSMHYGNPEAPFASDGRKAFPFFEDFDNTLGLAWDETITGFDPTAHIFDNGFDASDYSNQGYTLRLLSGDAVCFTQPQSMTVTMETFVGLPAADYCVELEAQAEVFDFLFTTSGTTSVAVGLNGSAVITENVSCEGLLCRQSTSWRSYRVFYPGRAIHTISLSVANGDCATSAGRFNDIRIFRCAAEEPAISFGEEIFCL